MRLVWFADPAELLEEPRREMGNEYDEATEAFLVSMIRGDLITGAFVEQWFATHYGVEVHPNMAAGIAGLMTEAVFRRLPRP